MAPSTKQVRLPFEQLTKANLKPIVRKFEKWGVKITDIDAPNKQKRESGSLIKEVTFTFDDGQKVLIRVKADGTVFQVRLNTRPIPIRAVDDMDKAVIEIVDAVQSNSKAFEKNRISRAKLRNKGGVVPVTTTRKEKLISARDDLKTVSDALVELEVRESDLSTSLNEKQAGLDKVNAELEAEKAKTVTLEAELKTLAAEAA